VSYSKRLRLSSLVRALWRTDATVAGCCSFAFDGTDLGIER